MAPRPRATRPGQAHHQLQPPTPHSPAQPIASTSRTPIPAPEEDEAELDSDEVDQLLSELGGPFKLPEKRRGGVRKFSEEEAALRRRASNKATAAAHRARKKEEEEVMLERIAKLEAANAALLRKVRRLEGELAFERGEELGVDAMGRKRRKTVAQHQAQLQQAAVDEEEEEDEHVPLEDLTWGDGSDDEDYEAPDEAEEEDEEEEESEMGEVEEEWDPGTDYTLPEGYGQTPDGAVPPIDLTKMNAAALQELAKLLQLATGGGPA